MKFIKIVFFILLNSHFLIAQKPISHSQDTSFQAFIHFSTNRIKQNISLLKHSKNDFKDDYLLKINELIVSNENSIEIKEKIKRNKEEPYSKYANYYLARNLFYEGKNNLSAIYLSDINSEDIFEREYAHYYFMKGYFEIEKKSFREAISFLKLAKSHGMDTEELTFYQGFAHYYAGNKEKASEIFSKIIQHKLYGNHARYFIAEIAYENEDYDKVIEIGTSYASEEKNPINIAYERLIGESFIKKGNIITGAEHLEKSIKLHDENQNPSAALYYQTAVAKLKSGDEPLAIDYFKKSGIGSSEFSTLSAYQLGQIYLSKKQYLDALMAFENVISSKNRKLLEESIYQSAKINALLERFDESLKYCDDYLSKFPEGKWKMEIQNLTANIYLKSSNYDLAIKFLDKIKNLTQIQKNIYQKIAFLKAQLLFNDANFSQSIKWFQKSNKYPSDKSLLNEAYFQIAEAYIALKKYKTAIKYYKYQNNPNEKTEYGLGYGFYNLNEYANALEHFRKAVRRLSGKYLDDANLRKADCEYALKKYDEALDSYQNVSQEYQKNYTSYQKSTILGIQNNIPMAVMEIRNIDKTSHLYPKAILLKADLFFKNSMFDKAENTYNEIINFNNDEEILAKTYHNRAVCRGNVNKLKAAENDYKFVIQKYPKSAYAFSSILGLQSLEQKGLKVSNFDDVRASFKANNPQGGSLEMIDFEAAKSKYFDQKYKSAIQSFKQYQKEYPKSYNLGEVGYFLADSYYRLNDFENAKTAFEAIKKQRTRYTGRILKRLGEIHSKLGNYDEAIFTFKALKSLNLSAKDNYFADYGKMKTYFLSKEYTKTIETANAIIKGEWKPINAIQEAYLHVGKSYLFLEKYNQSSEALSKINKETDIYAAEASFLLSFIQYKQGLYDESLESLFSLNNKFGSYAKWIDQSYLLIAKNYIAKEEVFQAQATLKSIFEHSKDEAIKAEVSKILLEIQQQKNNSLDSINTEK